MRFSALFFSSVVALLCTAAQGATVSGKVSSTDGKPLDKCFVALLNPGFASVANTVTAPDGAFSFDTEAKDGYLYVNPATHVSPSGEEARFHQPRQYKYAGETSIDITLPDAATLVLAGYTPQGKFFDYKLYETLGKYGGQFLYATNLQDEAVPAKVIEVGISEVTDAQDRSTRPAVVVEPGKPIALSIMFWPTLSYGKLQLKMDNGGKGYMLPQAGDVLKLNVNVELAKSAVAKLEECRSGYATGSDRIDALTERMNKLPEEQRAAAAEADAILADALRLRDELELARAKAAIPEVRKGKLTVQVTGAIAGGEYKVSVKQISRDFWFGAYEGSPYNAKAYEAARKAGFDFATVLPAWNWTQNPQLNKGAIDSTFGLGALDKLGYRIKAHGVVWMQDYGLMPEFAKGLSHDELKQQALAHQDALLDTIDPVIDVWEAMNEPANTNVPKLPRDDMKALVSGAATNIVAKGKPSLVNSPHEFSYGGKYWLHNLDGTPTDDFPQTYSEFLSEAQAAGTLNDIDIVGLQCYPGFHLNADWANAQGPAYTPSHLLDTLLQYTRFGRSIHITELSFPSSYGEDWYSGYWREKWTPQTQADYATLVYALAFAEPALHSITWWDITDAKPSVISGGLLEKTGKPKPVFEAITGLMEEWTSDGAEAAMDASGKATLDLFGGEYEVTVTGPKGFKHTETFHLMERWNGTVTVDAAG
jgi:hypothetical protein